MWGHTARMMLHVGWKCIYRTQGACICVGMIRRGNRVADRRYGVVRRIYRNREVTNCRRRWKRNGAGMCRMICPWGSG